MDKCKNQTTLEFTSRSEVELSGDEYLQNYKENKQNLQKSEQQFREMGNLGDDNDEPSFQDASQINGQFQIKSKDNSQDVSFDVSQIPIQNVSVTFYSNDINSQSQQSQLNNISVEQNNNQENINENQTFCIPISPDQIVISPQQDSYFHGKRIQEQDYQDDLKLKQRISLNHAAGKMIKKILINKDRIDFQMKEFILKLKQRIFWLKQPDSLSFKHYKLINDCSTSQYYIELRQDQKTKMRMKIEGGLAKKLSYFKIPIVLPFHQYSIIWDSIVVAYSTLFLYFYSIAVFFAQQVEQQQGWSGYFILAMIIFGCDIMISFRKAFQNEEFLITDQQQIAQRYMKSNFFYDFISFCVLLFKIFVSNHTFTYNPHHSIFTYFINMLIILKIFSLPNKINNIQNSLILKPHQKHLLRLANQIFIVVVAAHLMCLTWNILSIVEESLQFQSTWKTKINIQDFLWYDIYMYSLYWSMTTMSTVGYGDITPSNAVECLFVTISMVIMSCIFAFSINNIGMILNEIEKDSKELNDNIQIIHKFLENKGVEQELKTRVKHYLRFLSQESKKRNKDAEDQILSRLSNKLREEVITEINSNVLNKFNIFAKNFSQILNSKLVFALKEILVQPNQIIFQEEECGDDASIYFISSGEIEIYTSNTSLLKNQQNIVIAKLSDNQYFGEISFFTGQARSSSARSVNQTALYKLSRTDFLALLQNYKEDFEKYKMMQEQILFQNELGILNIECFSCKQTGHIVLNCPLIHCVLDRQFMVLKNNFSYFQHRGKRNQTIQSQANSIYYQVKDRNTVSPKQAKKSSILKQRKKFNSRKIKDKVGDAAIKLKQQAVYMGSAIFQYFNDMNEKYEENDERMIMPNTSIDNHMESDNLSSNSDSIDVPGIKQKLSKQFSETEMEELVDQIFGKRKKDLIFQKSLDQDYRSSSIDLINAVVLHMNSKKEIANESSPKSFSQQNIKQQNLETPPPKKSLVKWNTKDNMTSYLGQKIVFSKPDNILQQQSCFETQIDKDVSLLNPTDLQKYLQPHSVGSIIILQPASNTSNTQLPDYNSQTSNLNAKKFLLSQQRNNVSQLSNKTHYVETENSSKNLINYEIVFNSKQQLEKNDQPQQKEQLKQSMTEEINEQIQEFDCVKIFKRFFPNNNIDRVIKHLKQLIVGKQSKRKTIVQKRKRKEILTQSIFINNVNLQNAISAYRATHCSYGIHIKQSGYAFPINNITSQNIPF